MRITTTKENLLVGINAVQRAINAKSIIPIYSCIKLATNGNVLSFTGASLDMGIQCQMPVQVEREGIAVVPARYLSDIVRKLPDVPITLDLNDHHEMSILYEKSFFSLKTMPAEDFPTLPEFKGNMDFSISAEVLKNMVRQTAFACSTDEMKAIFTGLLWEIDGDNLRMVGTDTHRLAWTQGKIKTTDISNNGLFIFPAKTAIEIARLIQEEDCRVQVEKNMVFFSFENIKINCRILEGQFPNYKQVIPAQSKTKIIADAKLLQNCVDRISLFSLSGDTSNTIHLEIFEQALTIHSRSEIGSGKEEISIEHQGEELKIAFNARYLTDVFKVIDESSIAIEFSGPLSAGVLRIPENNDFLYLILPIRV
jgi:DNA polymerase-3 subunit beta